MASLLTKRIRQRRPVAGSIAAGASVRSRSTEPQANWLPRYQETQADGDRCFKRGARCIEHFGLGTINRSMRWPRKGHFSRVARDHDPRTAPMKPTLGWTVLSRDEVRQVERALSNGEQDTRDEIGFLLIHQGLADRFFPGTSVLHTRIRYVLFIPWLYRRAAQARRRGRDLEMAIRDMLIELAIRLREHGDERTGVIGGEKLHQLTSQPPDRSYWSALRTWGILRPDVHSRSEALRRLRKQEQPGLRDDDGAPTETVLEVFSGLPNPPENWDQPDGPLHFKLSSGERRFLRERLGRLVRTDGKKTLLAHLADISVAIDGTHDGLPLELDDYADADDREALGIARDMAALAAIGRSAYGALVEERIAADGGVDDRTFRTQLKSHFATFGERADRCDLSAAKRFLQMPPYLVEVLKQTQAFVRGEETGDLSRLLASYQHAEEQRKGGRARLGSSERAVLRREGWLPERHNTTPLHYRWDVVSNMLADLSSNP